MFHRRNDNDLKLMQKDTMKSISTEKMEIGVGLNLMCKSKCIYPKELLFDFFNPKKVFNLNLGKKRRQRICIRLLKDLTEKSVELLTSINKGRSDNNKLDKSYTNNQEIQTDFPDKITLPAKKKFHANLLKTRYIFPNDNQLKIPLSCNNPQYPDPNKWIQKSIRNKNISEIFQLNTSKSKLLKRNLLFKMKDAEETFAYTFNKEKRKGNNNNNSENKINNKEERKRLKKSVKFPLNFPNFQKSIFNIK